MDTENRKINYNNDIECVKEEPVNFENLRNSFQDPISLL